MTVVLFLFESNCYSLSTSYAKIEVVVIAQLQFSVSIEIIILFQLLSIVQFLCEGFPELDETLLLCLFVSQICANQKAAANARLRSSPSFSGCSMI
ncbi:hypothetical protein QVD17_09176 [Tagetes erecta]|uniref:Uncharacterized protein n=1 Tax=Tagetes erecta TaxID=13708 RepID=A0AAD8L3U8_TARER|nr:hypothetical protein QVD17_09176 [Tagetes erecta]